jgi:hypothetical protein
VLQPPHAFSATQEVAEAQHLPSELKQEAAVHSHVPLSHASPPVHDLHAPPLDPHVAMLCVSQVVPLQHPSGQDVPSQTHAPSSVQRWPVLQPKHAAPPVPHWPSDSFARSTHVVPSQQPEGHDVALQTHLPALHCCVDVHSSQATPPVPQVVLPEVLQMLSSQQPSGQLLASQTQLPASEHSWPEGHAVQATPLAPQRVLLSLATVTHVPLLQHPAQLLPPHKHEPAVHAWP